MLLLTIKYKIVLCVFIGLISIIVQVPEFGEGADHRERVKHFVYDYAYTTKSGPIPKLHTADHSDSYSYQNSAVSFDTKTQCSPGLLVESASTTSAKGATASTPLYFTASSPFLIPPSLANFASGNSNRSFYSLPCFASSFSNQQRLYSSLDDQFEKNITENSDNYLKTDYKDADLELQQRQCYSQPATPRTKPVEGQSFNFNLPSSDKFPHDSPLTLIPSSRFLNEQRLKRSLINKTPPQSLIPFHQNLSHRTETTLGPITLPRNLCLGPHVPPNTPIGGSIKSKSHRSVSCSQPYPLRAPSRARAKSVGGGYHARPPQVLENPVDEWALPSSPEEAFWQAESQQQVRYKIMRTQCLRKIFQN